MKKINMIVACFLGILTTSSNALFPRYIRGLIVATRSFHSNTPRFRAIDYSEAQTRFERAQEQRLHNMRANLLETMRRNTELMNSEIALLKARIEQIEVNRVTTHRESAIAQQNLLDKPLR